MKWSVATDPMAWNLTGEFLFKDIVLLCVRALLLLASLPQSVVQSRTAWYPCREFAVPRRGTATGRPVAEKGAH